MTLNTAVAHRPANVVPYAALSSLSPGRLDNGDVRHDERTVATADGARRALGVTRKAAIYSLTLQALPITDAWQASAIVEVIAPLTDNVGVSLAVFDTYLNNAPDQKNYLDMTIAPRAPSLVDVEIPGSVVLQRARGFRLGGR